jgi:hypothetical protein
MYRSIRVALRNFRRPNTIIWPQSEQKERLRKTAAGGRPKHFYTDPRRKIMPISSQSTISPEPAATAAAEG